MQVIKGKGSTDVRLLWRLTYETKREEIDNGNYASIYELMKNHCPVLNEVEYVRDRFYLNDQFSCFFTFFKLLDGFELFMEKDLCKANLRKKSRERSFSRFF